MEKLNNVFQAASQEMYNAANAQGGDPTGDAGARELAAQAKILKMKLQM